MGENRELLFIVYKIAVDGLTRQNAEQQMAILMDEYSLKDDIELKENYIIREIWLPSFNGEGSDVKVIYPNGTMRENKTKLKEVAQELDSMIKQSNSSPLKREWVKLLREIKLNDLEND